MCPFFSIHNRNRRWNKGKKVILNKVTNGIFCRKQIIWGAEKKEKKKNYICSGPLVHDQIIINRHVPNTQSVDRDVFLIWTWTTVVFATIFLMSDEGFLFIIITFFLSGLYYKIWVFGFPDENNIPWIDSFSRFLSQKEQNNILYFFKSRTPYLIWFLYAS